MHLVMFDIDGTLIESYESDSLCFERAIFDSLHISPDTNWSKYTHVTDAGILDEIISIHGIQGRREQIHSQVKNKFIEYLDEYLLEFGVKEIEGASAFLDLLKKRKDVVISIATGGWEESAKLKLHSAGIDCTDMVIASASDHFDRTMIMSIAESRLEYAHFTTKNYFGDACWDKKATEKLGYNFILVGNGLEHNQQIDDYKNANEALSYIGL